MAAGVESSDNEFGILEYDRCTDTGHLLHELVFACSNSPPRQPQNSFTILTQADWCASRIVAGTKWLSCRLAGLWEWVQT